MSERERASRHHAPPEAGLELTRHLRARLVPVAIVAAVVIAVTAPGAYYYVGVRELRVHGGAMAREVARHVGREARERPELWRYDTHKLVAHVREVRGLGDFEGLAEIVEVTDRAGARLGIAPDDGIARLEKAGCVWASAAVPAPSGGDVWVGVSTASVERRTTGLFAGFSVLALVLGALVYAIPRRAAIRAGSRIDGLMAVLASRERKLRDWNRKLEREVKHRSSELLATNEALARKESELRELAARAVALQEEERRGIARDLHDSVGQVLAAVRIQLQLLRERVVDDARASVLVDHAVALTDGTVEEVRRAVERLGPAVVDDVGLSAALARACDDFGERTRLDVRVEVAGVRASPAVERALYRIAQEALTNVARHAGATLVTVRLSAVAAQGEALASVALEVEDDGRGIRREILRGTASPGHGLRGMRERALLLGGQLDVRSREGAGTRIRAVLPRGASPD